MHHPVSERKPACVVFDLGNVLVRWHPRNAFAPLFRNDPRDLDHFLDNICNMDWHNRLDAGLSFREGITELSARFPDHADMIAAYDSRWKEMFNGEIRENVDLVRKLHTDGVPLFALTNFPKEKYDDFRRAYGFMDSFRDVVVSGHEGVIKPDMQIYRILLERTGFPAEQTLFIDDRKENILAADALGFQTHHFQSPKRLTEELLNQGLLA
ncbi:HAD family hydrolase [Emcibacter nanhaiensis]|uniref:HAD family hydrolase n=1 Tax=Emcibacter nanhaiensis TaxID=1505037 RepID=UPI0015E3C4E1|nr:HAD family phosphatase [Emcibacter nanhaiensis]